MPTELNYPHQNPIDALLEYLRSRPNDVLLIDEHGLSLTYEELYNKSAKLANSLSRLGINYGDRIAIMMGNSVEAIISLFAAWMLGAATVMIDPLTISEDLDYQLSDSIPRVIITDKSVIERESTVLSKYRVISIDTAKENVLSFQDLLSAGSLIGFKPVEVKEDDVGLIYYYAGIAGRTMQVWHTYSSLYSGPYAFGEAIGLDHNDSVLVVAQLSHILGLTEFMSAFVRGARALIAKRFDAKDTPELIHRYGVTVFAGVPLMFDQILNNKDLSSGMLSSLRLTLSAAAPLSQSTQLGFYQRFGVPLVQFYGLTEAYVLTVQPIKYKDVTNTVGSAIPGSELKIVNPNDPSRELGIGEVGELTAKAPWVMKGYSDPEDTRRAFYNGWLLTGDLMTMDDKGLLYFKGVKKRMIKYKGYPIFPRDLEIMLMKHPAVKEVYVTGEQADDPSIGQLPVAYVVLHDEYRGKITDKDLIDFVNSRVAFYKKLRKVYFVDRLPTKP